MSFLLETIVRSAAVPAALSIAVLLVWRWTSRSDVGSRHAAAWAVAVAFVAGYLLLPSAPVVPSSHWHWLLYLAILATILAPVGLAAGVHLTERWGLQLVIALLAAWFLVPDWSDIVLQRPLYLAALAGTLFLLSVSLDALVSRIPDASVPLSMFVTAAAGAIVLALSGNMKFAHLGGTLASGNLGCALIWAFGRWKPRFQGAVPGVTVLLGGLMFAGYVNSFSDVPAVSYLLVPVAPLALSVCLLPPVRNWPRSRRLMLQAVVVLVPLTASVVLALQAEFEPNHEVSARAPEERPQTLSLSGEQIPVG